MLMTFKMKIKFLFILIFFTTKLSACKCKRDAIAQDYFEADVVGIIVIDSTYGDTFWEDRTFGSRTYKAKIHFDKLYKGQKFEELNIIGNSKSINSGACETQVKLGEKYLILLNKNNKGEYVVSQCSSMFPVDYNNSKNLVYYQNLFHYLEKNKVQLQKLEIMDFYDKSDNWEGNEFVKTFGNQLKYKFGIYKVKVDAENNIIAVNPIKKIGLDEKKVSALIRKNLKVYYFSNKNPNAEYLLFLDSEFY